MSIKLLHLHCYFELALGCNSSIVYSIVRCHVPHHLVPCFYSLEWSGLDDRLKQLSSPERKIKSRVESRIEILTSCSKPEDLGPNDLKLTINLTYEKYTYFNKSWTVIFQMYPGGFWRIRQDGSYQARRKIHLLGDVTTDLVNLVETYMTFKEFRSCDLTPRDQLRVFNNGVMVFIKCKNGFYELSSLHDSILCDTLAEVVACLEDPLIWH